MRENISFFFSGDGDRDIFNEKPSKEEQMAATQVTYAFYPLIKDTVEIFAAPRST